MLKTNKPKNYKLSLNEESYTHKIPLRAIGGPIRLDYEFLGRFHRDSELDTILNNLYMVVSRDNSTVICTGLRVSEGYILVPNCFEHVTMTRSGLKRFSGGPRIHLPEHFVNYYEEHSGFGTLFFVDIVLPSYAYKGNGITVGNEHTFLLYAAGDDFYVQQVTGLDTNAEKDSPSGHREGEHSTERSNATEYTALPGAIAITQQSNGKFTVTGYHVAHNFFLRDDLVEMLLQDGVKIMRPGDTDDIGRSTSSELI